MSSEKSKCRIIISSGLLLVATFLTAFCVAEISFPETFLTISDKDWFLEIFPNAWKWSIEIAIGALIGAILLIFPALKIHKDFSVRALEMLFRLGIGGMFVFASIFKIQDPHQFATLVAQYQFLPEFSNNFFALVYPQFELWFGLALMFSPWARESALAIFLMFISFVIALSWALFHDLGITCGCFDLGDDVNHDKNEAWTSLIRDLILLVPTTWLLFRKNKSIIGIWRGFKA